MSTPPCAEARGRAREFRRSLTGVHAAEKLLIAHLKRLSARLAEGRPIRPEQISELERLLLVRLNGPWRLLAERSKTRQKLTIATYSVQPTRIGKPGWSDTEESVEIVAGLIIIDRSQVCARHETLATVSLHALARWFERSFKWSREALMIDLLDLTLDSQKLLINKNYGRFVYSETTSGGAWWGHPARTVDLDGVEEMTVAIRTFYSDDDKIARIKQSM